MNVTLGTPGSDRDRDREPQSLAERLTEQLALRKGAMYDYCILRGLEIAVPDKGMRDLFMEHHQPVPGFGVTTSYHNVPANCEKVTVTYLNQTLVEALISSIIYTDRIEIKLEQFKIRNGAGELVDAPHIYHGN